MSRWLRLKFVAKVVTSNVDKLRKADEIPVRLINYTDVYYGDRLTPDLPLMEATASSSEIVKFRLIKGDVIVTKDSETADDIGVAAYVERSDSDMLCGYHLSRIRPDPSVAIGRYVFWALASDHAREQMSIAATGVTRFGLRSDSVRDLLINLPSKREQGTIANYLDIETGRIDALISKKRRMIELFSERWAAEVVRVMRGKKPASSGTSRVALRRVIDHTIGGAWGSPAGEGDIDAVCIRGTDFDTANLEATGENAPTRSFAVEEFRRRSLLSGDLLIEKSGGGDKQPVGRAVRWIGDGPGVPTNFVARLRPTSGVDSRYLTFLFRAAYEEGRTRAWIKQTTGIQNLDLGGFLSEKYRIPPLRDQSAIATRLGESNDHRSRGQRKLKAQIDLLAERRQALITAAVTGKLLVPGVAA